MRYYDAHNLTSWRSCHNKWTSCDQVIIYSSWTLWVFLAKSLRPRKLCYSVRSQQPMSIDNDGCFCYQLNGISDSVSNLHKSSLQKKKNCFSRFLCGGWLCRRVVIRGQRVVQGQSSGPAAWCAVCKMLNKRYIFVVIRGSSSPHPGTTCWLCWLGNANWIQCGS